MPRLKTGTIVPTDAEDSAITAAALSDEDAAPYSDEQWAEAKKTVVMGRPKLTVTKQLLTVRYDADVVAAFKATGKGWQSRMNDALRDWLKTHSPAQ